MRGRQTYCEAPGCEEPTQEGRRFCPRDTKRFQRMRAGRSAPALGTPAAERLPPMERALEAMNRLAETPAEDDEAYDANKRALMGVLKELGGRAWKDAIRDGLARARARGVRIGRPPKLGEQALAVARALVDQVGIMAAAKALQVDRRTLNRALGEWQKGSFSVVQTQGDHRQEARVSVGGPTMQEAR